MFPNQLELKLSDVAVKDNSRHCNISSVILLILIFASNLLKRIDKLHYFHTKYKISPAYYIDFILYH